MWSNLYFSQLPGQYQLFGIPFHVQTNCSRFVECTLAKSWRWKLISYIKDSKKEEIFYFLTIVILFKLKTYEHNTDKTSYNLVQCSRKLFVKFYYKIKQPLLSNLPKNSWLVIFEEFPRHCSIRCGVVLWISTSVYVIPFSTWKTVKEVQRIIMSITPVALL